MVSVSLIAMTILGIYQATQDPDFSFKSFIKDKSYAGLVLIFIVVLFSGINSDNHTEWIHQIKLKLPFLFLPFAFYAIKPIDRDTHQWIHYAFIATVLISSFQVLITCLADFKAISLSIGKGKAIPTPIDHIHYSIMVAYAIVSSFIYCIISKNKKWKIGLFLVGIFLFGFAHFLSVRTGLALSYSSLVFILGWYVIRNKKYVTGLVTVVLMAAIPFIAFKTIEPFKRKINYMYWDFAKYKQGKGKSYSDSERLMSYEIASDLIKESPFFGHGVGDLRPIMVRKHKEKFGQKEKYIYPHNQYLYVLTTMGVLGAIFFFGGLLSPVLFAERRNIFLAIIFILMMMSFLVENTIQRAVITGFYLFFVLLNLGVEKNEDKIEI